MAEQRPLVVIGGRVQQLPTGDTVAGATGGGSTSLTIYKYTATAAQTAFTGADDDSNTLDLTDSTPMVVVNGATLEPTADYTFTNDTLTLVEAAEAGDEVNLFVFGVVANGGGGGGGGAEPAFDPTVNSPGNLTFTNSNRTVEKTAGDTAWGDNSCAWLAGAGFASGKHYIEVVCDVNIDTNGIHGMDNNQLVSSHIGDGSGQSFGWYFTAQYRPGTQGAGVSIANGDVLMIAIDVDNFKAFFGKNGTWFNSEDPVAGTGNHDFSADFQSGQTPYYYGITLYKQGDKMTIRTGAEAQYVPTGYSYMDGT